MVVRADLTAQHARGCLVYSLFPNGYWTINKSTSLKRAVCCCLSSFFPHPHSASESMAGKARMWFVAGTVLHIWRHGAKHGVCHGRDAGIQPRPGHASAATTTGCCTASRKQLARSKTRSFHSKLMLTKLTVDYDSCLQSGSNVYSVRQTSAILEVELSTSNSSQTRDYYAVLGC